MSYRYEPRRARTLLSVFQRPEEPRACRGRGSRARTPTIIEQGEITMATTTVKVKRLPMSVKAGDRILIGKYSGTEVKIEGEDYLILREDDVLAIVQG